jgi:Xaa-Pro aminopeptidase
MRQIYESIPPGLGFEVHRIAEEPNMLPFVGDLMPSVTEEMDLSDEQGLTFEPGQVICVELWHGHMGGIEDMYVMTETGLERISRLPREIRVIDCSR